MSIEVSGMERKSLIKEIKILHDEIDRECSDKLEVLNRCFEEGRECEDCALEGECRFNLPKLLEISRLYEELYSKSS